MSGPGFRTVLWFACSGLRDADDTHDMIAAGNGGFSPDASLCIDGYDRAGLERLLRYRAPPPIALERLAQVNGHQVICRLPNPQCDGCTALSLAATYSYLCKPAKTHKDHPSTSSVRFWEEPKGLRECARCELVCRLRSGHNAPFGRIPGTARARFPV